METMDLGSQESRVHDRSHYWTHDYLRLISSASESIFTRRAIDLQFTCMSHIETFRLDVIEKFHY